MGLLSLDILGLEVLKRGGKPHEQVPRPPSPHTLPSAPSPTHTLPSTPSHPYPPPLTPSPIQRYARRILHLVRRHHLLLVTLLLANAVAVESMPIFLAKLTSEVVAVIVSVTAVLLFGE